MTETVLIKEKSIASAWYRLLSIINTRGEFHIPDYGVPTRRVHATLHITDPYARELHNCMPFGALSLEKYKEEITEEYADWYTSLPDDDKRKFDYCYAKQLFRYGKVAYNTLKENIENLRVGSRRHVGVLWENEIHIPKFEDQPCWIAYKLEKTPDDTVILYILYRSWDAYGGASTNIPGILYGVNKALKESSDDLRVSEIIATGWDTHIYDTDMPAVQKLLVEIRQCGICGDICETSSMRPSTKGYICPFCG